MAWNKVTKDELKEAGLDVDAFTTASEKIKKIDEMETTLKGVKESVDSFAAIKDQLAGLENKLKEFKPSAGAGANDNNNASTDSTAGGGEEAQLDWVLEPEKATTTTINKIIGPIAAATADVRAQMIYQNFANSNPKGFRKYEKDIKEMWDKQPLASRQNPDLIKNCYKIVMADHLDEISKGGESFFVEAGGSNISGGGVGESKKKAVDILTKDQLDLCKKWDVDPEDYLKELNTQYA